VKEGSRFIKPERCRSGGSLSGMRLPRTLGYRGSGAGSSRRGRRHHSSGELQRDPGASTR
jgi:hypothetical protein